jgi:hypothetical protein
MKQIYETVEVDKKEFIKKLIPLLEISLTSFEYKVVRKPKGMRIIQEVSQEQMDAIIRKAAEKAKAVKDGEKEVSGDDSDREDE